MMRWQFLAIGLVSLWLTGSMSAATVDDKHAADKAGHVDHGKAGSDEHGHGKPFSLIPDKADLGIWSLIVFLILFGVLAKFAWKPILGALQAREAGIHSKHADAEKARADAADLRAALQKQLDDAHLQVKALIDEAKRDAQAMTDEMIAKAKADISTERDRMQRDLKTQTDQALQSLWTRAAEVATQLSATALRKQIDMPTHRKLIDQALADIRQRESARHA